MPNIVKRHISGYTSFGIDITDLCRFGAQNAIAVQVDASDNELWSYEGGGIYRAVRLVKTAKQFVPQWGTVVTTGSSAETAGEVVVSTELRNMAYEPVTAVAKHLILDAAGQQVAAVDSAEVELPAIDSVTVTQQTHIPDPQLWSVDSPTLYTLRTEIHVGGACVDRTETPFGVRFFHFDAETGFWLNGEPLKLKGTCCHQDHAAVGVAVTPALQAFRVRRLKEMGSNALRTSHNPPDPALLDACDRLGMLVMDETRMMGSSAEMLTQLSDLIRRDRNHPSVILWSLGNEEMNEQHTESGIAIFRRMQHEAHRLDATRPTTFGMNMNWIEICDAHAEADFRFDVWGSNYRSGQRSEHYDEFHARYPDWPMLGSETYGGASTRGLYEPDTALGEMYRHHKIGWNNPKRAGFASAYGETTTPWGYSIEETWQDCVKRPFMAGTFLWTGFDYRGEIFPYTWPAVITRFGLIDYCGWFKPVAHYLRAWWRPDEPHLFLMPHWDWRGHEGESIDVWCYGNSAEVELFLNDHSLGRRAMPVNDKLTWDVLFTPGTLRAVGYDEAGKVVASAERTTPSAPAAMQLTCHSEPEPDDATTLHIIDVQIVDASGNPCDRADNLVQFDVSEGATVLGVGNGDPMSHEPDKAMRRKAYHGKCQIILSAETDVTVSATSWGLADAAIAVTPISA